MLQNDTDIACLLLSYGAYPDGERKFSDTPLSLAVGNQNIVAILALLRYGVDINDGVDAEGGVLHTAVQRGNVEIVQLLLENGIDLALTDEDGEDALTYARLCREYWKTEPRAEIVRILERAQVISGTTTIGRVKRRRQNS